MTHVYPEFKMQFWYFPANCSFDVYQSVSVTNSSRLFVSYLLITVVIVPSTEV